MAIVNVTALESNKNLKFLKTVLFEKQDIYPSGFAEGNPLKVVFYEILRNIILLTPLNEHGLTLVP